MKPDSQLLVRRLTYSLQVQQFRKCLVSGVRVTWRVSFSLWLHAASLPWCPLVGCSSSSVYCWGWQKVWGLPCWAQLPSLSYRSCFPTILQLSWYWFLLTSHNGSHHLQFHIDQILCENCALKYSVLSLVPRFFLLRRREPGNEAIRLSGWW